MDTIYTKEQFQSNYGSRDWTWYQGKLKVMLGYGLKEPVLDIGCGLGMFVECCVRNDIKCMGIEGSLAAVEAAKKRYPGLGVIHHDIQKELPFATGSFGTTVVNQVVEHLPMVLVQRVLSEMLRLLHEGGVAFVYSPSRYNTIERKKPEHINLFAPSQLQKALKEVGFVHIKPIDSPLPLLGTSRIGKAIMARIFRVWHPDWLSASANCLAEK